MTPEASNRSAGRWRLLRHGDEPWTSSLVEASDNFVDRLGLPRPTTWSDLQAAVETVYGKPIYLVASNSQDLNTVTGLWIDTPSFGAIVCRERDDLYYQSQNACHELAHILFLTAPDEWFNQLLPRLPRWPTVGRGATQSCAPVGDQETIESRVEIAVEEVAFAMTRRIQSINRTAEEAYFG